MKTKPENVTNEQALQEYREYMRDVMERGAWQMEQKHKACGCYDND